MQVGHLNVIHFTLKSKQARTQRHNLGTGAHDLPMSKAAAAASAAAFRAFLSSTIFCASSFCFRTCNPDRASEMDCPPQMRQRQTCAAIINTWETMLLISPQKQLESWKRNKSWRRHAEPRLLSWIERHGERVCTRRRRALLSRLACTPTGDAHFSRSGAVLIYGYPRQRSHFSKRYGKL